MKAKEAQQARRRRSLANRKGRGGQDNSAIAYMRHTGQWQEVYTDQSLEKRLAIIRLETLFQP